MDWRQTLSFLKNADQEIPLTLDYVKDGKIKPGDFVTLKGTAMHPKENKVIFKPFVLYKVLEIYPQEGPSAQGLILNSELGKWYVHFDEDGGAGYFFHVTLTPEEELGQLEGLPFQIMEMLHKYKSITRNTLISEILQENYSEDKKKMDSLKNDIFRAIKLLLDAGKIQRSKRPGFYELSLDGQKEMQEHYKGPLDSNTPE